jgi:hypothetical protein
MDANILGIAFLIGLGTYFGYNQPIAKIDPIFNIQEGKPKVIQSIRGDASMRTELLRRQTIQRVGRVKPQYIKENFTQSGSTTGYLETFMITGIGELPASVPCISDIIYDGGSYSDNFCPIPGSDYLDAGNQNTRVCESCPKDIIYDGGGQSANYCPIHGDGSLDGGNQNTKACGV